MPLEMQRSICDAISVLSASQPADKQAAAFALRDNLSEALDTPHIMPALPTRPARPTNPELVSPAKLRRRRLGTPKGRAALLHAVAHIEFNAIDLAADMIARFSAHPVIQEQDRAQFIKDWAEVCHDEARHFGLISARLGELDTRYGDLPAHDGLWQAADATSGDFAARLAIAPMVLEARGLDVTPPMIAKLRAVQDEKSADILQIIYDDEIDHVAKGRKWFSYVCKQQGLDEISSFHDKVRTYFAGLLKPPFNEQARDLAGMSRAFYMPLSTAEL